MTLRHSLVESRLRHCSTVWGNCNSSLKTKIQQIQNKAVRIVTRTVEPDNLLKENGLLNVQQLIDFEISVIVHKSLNDSAPE